MSLPAWDQQVEHDRASTVLGHHAELAGKPLVSHEVVVNLIGATTTTTGLRVKSELDTNQYPAGHIVSDDELSAIHIRRDVFLGDWNYSLFTPPWVALKCICYYMAGPNQLRLRSLGGDVLLYSPAEGPPSQ